MLFLKSAFTLVIFFFSFSFKKKGRSRFEILTEAFFQFDSMGSCTGLGKVELQQHMWLGLSRKELPVRLVLLE